MDTSLSQLDDITKEMIDYEPTNANTESRDTSGPDAPPSAGDGWGFGNSSAAASDEPEQLRRTSRAIGDTLADIAAGRTSGSYPGVDRILAPGRPGNRPVNRNPIDHRWHRPQQGAHESTFAATSQRFIADVRPAVKERLAVAEHQIEHLSEKAADAYAIALQAAPSEVMHEAIRDVTSESNRRIDSIHKRLDREIIPELKELQGKRLIRDWALSISLAVTIVYSIVLTVKNLLH